MQQFTTLLYKELAWKEDIAYKHNIIISIQRNTLNTRNLQKVIVLYQSKRQHYNPYNQ